LRKEKGGAEIGDRPIIEKRVAKVLVICKGGF
jgi:hypothetical protein